MAAKRALYSPILRTSPRPPLRRAHLASAACLTACLAATSAHAVDPFEIQVYDGTANAPGAPGVELHTNYVASGAPNAVAEPSEDRQAHVTLEPSFGVRPWWELGGYIEAARRADGTLDYGGVKLRSKFVTPPGWDEHWRLGLNFELSLLPVRYDPDRIGTELRPIAAWESEDWLFAINPIVDTPLAGPDLSAGPSFEPALMAVRKLGAVSAGLEYYANFGPFSDPLPWREQEHYVFEVVNLLSVPNFELNAGIGEGLTPGSSTLVAKLILGYVWERRAEAAVMRRQSPHSL